MGQIVAYVVQRLQMFVMQLTGVFLKLLPPEYASLIVLIMRIIVIAVLIIFTVTQLTGVFLKLLQMELASLIVPIMEIIVIAVLIMFTVTQLTGVFLKLLQMELASLNWSLLTSLH